MRAAHVGFPSWPFPLRAFAASRENRLRICSPNPNERSHPRADAARLTWGLLRSHDAIGSLSAKSRFFALFGENRAVSRAICLNLSWGVKICQ